MPTNHTSTSKTEQTHDGVHHGRLSGTRNTDIASLLSPMGADRYASHDMRVDIAHLLMLADHSIFNMFSQNASSAEKRLIEKALQFIHAKKDESY